MEINWMGQSYFRIKGKQVTVLTDPFLAENGNTSNRVTANVICLSYANPAADAAIEKISPEPYIIRGPGEYEVSNVLVIGVPSYQDENKGSIRGKNTIYALEFEELSICHLGRLGHLLNDEQIEMIGNVDILFLPVGGNITINAALAAKLVRSMEPKIVIPMHYKTPGTNLELDPVDKFLSEIGAQGITAQPKFNITKNNLPQATQVILLDNPS